MWSLFRGVTWWLPLTDSFLFQGPLPTDDTVAIATLGGLRKELEKLNQLASVSYTHLDVYKRQGSACTGARGA